MLRHPSNSLGLTSLTHDVNSLPDAHRARNRLAVFVHGHQHARLRRDEQVVQHEVVLRENRLLHVQHAERVDNEAGEGNVGVQRTVGVRRGQGEQTLSEVHETLRNAHEEQQRRVLVVVARQLTKLRSEASVVGAGADDTESEGGRLRDVLVAVVAKASEHIRDLQFGVGDVQHSKTNRTRLAHGGVTVLDQVIVRAHRHVRPELFSRSNQRHAEGGD
mmetsp:Transcript_8044/g.26725  ORF Transcript_8044/g.26725 Transcript_8044/m.26725 type:complete len:218 (-) Transcript_8044:37-690(-)